MIKFIMEKKIISVFLVFLFYPFFASADWIRLFSMDKRDLYIDSNSIMRNGNKIFYNQLVDYNNIQPKGILSFKTYSEVNCLNLKVRDLNYELFKKQMGKGRNYYRGTPKKDWKYYKQGTSAHLLNKILCERVYNN